MTEPAAEETTTDVIAAYLLATGTPDKVTDQAVLLAVAALLRS